MRFTLFASIPLSLAMLATCWAVEPEKQKDGVVAPEGGVVAPAVVAPGDGVVAPRTVAPAANGFARQISAAVQSITRPFSAAPPKRVVAPPRAVQVEIAANNPNAEVKSVDEEATHEQAALITVPEATNVNAFCLSPAGNILAACGQGPGEIRVLDGEGSLLHTWEVDFKPEAINTAKDGSILVAGQGKLLRLSAEGKVLHQADSPHATAIAENQDKLRAEAENQLKSRSGSLTVQIATYERIINELTEKATKEELNDQENQILEMLPAQLEIFKQRQANQGPEGEPKISEKQIEDQMKALTTQKSRVASISTDGKHTYVATPALVGYTYDVWKMDDKFENAEIVVSELRGCCGQMDVQACEAGIFVAENARHRVAAFKSDGTSLTSWGKPDRSGADGFTSCCNPMNVCFSSCGDVFTAESTTGRIKRFAADGTFKSYVGDVKLVPGCKNVSIAVSADLDKIYMLDMTRGHIVLMERKGEPAAEKEVSTDNKSAE